MKDMPAPDQLDSWYDQYAQSLFGFLLNLTRNEADTRDLLQEIFIKLVRQPDLLQQARDPRAFLLRMAHNAVIDLTRRRGARQRTVDSLTAESVEFFEPAPDEAAFQKTLAQALGELPAEQRAVVHLKLWEGLTFAEIADLLQVPPNTAASRYRYGIDKLRDRLRPLYDEIK